MCVRIWELVDNFYDVYIERGRERRERERERERNPSPDVLMVLNGNVVIV